ncbi:MAG: nucleotidyltransferase domain-containing protein [Verrucomicrobiota bacterium]
MKEFTHHSARSPSTLFFECVTGSRAYGTDTPQSDTDLRGVFVMPRNDFFGLEYLPQVSDAKNDETYYEIGRFIQLLAKNNPNLLEMLFAEDSSIRFQHPDFSLIQPEWVLSKLCLQTFAGYAMTQVKKARGLNKKIVNPMEGPRKSVLDFCYILQGQGAVPVLEWLTERGWSQDQCGLVNIPHMRDIYGVYIGDAEMQYRGIVRREDSTELNLSSIPKGEEPVGWMSFNKDGFKKYCKEYREYQEWLANRNEARYATNIDHGRNYDSKNLMHTFRLLHMAEEVATEQRVRVRRPNRDFLMRIRAGEFLYEDLLKQAEDKILDIEAAFEKADLPDRPNEVALEKVLVEIRERWYGVV